MPAASKLKVQCEIEGLDVALENFKNIGYRAYQTRPLMERLVNVLQAQQAARFYEDPWTPLKDDTVERKNIEGEVPETFRDESRKIRGTATRVPDAIYYGVTMPGFPHQIRRVTRASATFGLDSEGNHYFFYARLVQNVKGTKRRILAISESDALTLADLSMHYIFSGWSGKRGTKR